MGIKDLPFPTDPTWDKEHSNPRAEVLPFGIYSQFTLPVAHFRIMNRDVSERIHPELLLWEPSPRQSDKSSKCYDNNSISLKTKTKRREKLLKINTVYFIIEIKRVFNWNGKTLPCLYDLRRIRGLVRQWVLDSSKDYYPLRRVSGSSEIGNIKSHFSHPSRRLM